MLRFKIFSAGAFASAVIFASLPAFAMPRGYNTADSNAQAVARLSIPWSQWYNDLNDEPRAYQGRYTREQTARTWYIPAPNGSINRSASIDAQGNRYINQPEPEQRNGLYQRYAGTATQSNDYYPPSAFQKNGNYQRYASTAAPSSNDYYPQAAFQMSYQPDTVVPQEDDGGTLSPRFHRQSVAYNGPEQPGTIIIDTEQRFLFLVQEDGHAIRYGIGVGRPGFEWAGVKSISRKSEWPDWTPPDDMLTRRPDLPRFMPGGPGNPLGARAMYLGSSLYRIHGTNEPQTIGKAVSSGCIRMVNDDVIDLYNRVRLGTKVVVI